MRKKYFCIMMALIAIIAAMNVIAPNPPTPHSVAGYIYQSDGSTQVPKGTNYSINDTTSGYYVKSATNFPIPQFSGRYFNTISGVDSDIVIVRAWNTSHYGETIITLAGDMDGINVWLNLTRATETNVTITDPLNGTALNMSYYYNITAKIGMLIGSGTDCNATLAFNDTSLLVLAPGETYLHQIGSINLGDYYITSWNVSAEKEGIIKARVEAMCANTNISLDNRWHGDINLSVRNVRPPNITAFVPQNLSWIKENATFYYNVTYAIGIRNCSIYIDSKLNQTSTPFYPAASYNFTIQNLTEGTHYWNIMCFDNSTIPNSGNSSILTIYSDKTAPDIRLLGPENNNISSNNTVVFNYNVTENYVISNCSLIINGTLADTNTSVITGNVTQNFTKTLTRGLYNWTINCTDAANNTASAASRLVNVVDPDLAVGAIIFSTQSPYENQLVGINATIINYGDDKADSFLTRVYEADAFNNWLLIDSFTLSIPAGSNTSINTSWAAKAGTYNISVLADTPLSTNGTVSEFNESNNAANRSVFVSIWNVYYGLITSDIVLSSDSSSLVFKWPSAVNMTPAIYAADSDSAINWSAVQALGINSTGNLSMADFSSADTALGLTAYEDSINRTYTSASQRRNVSSFAIFGNAIQNVSIAQSTNNSNFTTGILWDVSDSIDGRYSGTEDLIFVTNVNVHSIGTYGTYDYELRVPARLKQYLIPNNYNTITFYTELT